MISVKDTLGIVHEACPRCGNEWEYIGGTGEDTTYHCTNEQCGMMACHHVKDNFFLTVEMGKFTLYWYETGTMVDITDTGEPMDETDTGGFVEERKESTHLPILPFDISCARLKILLTFS